MKSKALILSLTMAVITPAFVLPAIADVTSPRISGEGKKYSKDRPDVERYGTGSAGRMTEASELRINVEELISDGDWEHALPKIRKAVQFDAGDPQGHLMLAKCLTMKFYANKGAVDEKLLNECLMEWQMIRYHDADPNEQWDAGQQAKKLEKIKKALVKDKLRMQKDKEMQEAIAARRDSSGGDDDDDAPTPAVKVAARDSSGKVNVRENVKSSTLKSDDADDDDSDLPATPAKKKHFGVF